MKKWFFAGGLVGAAVIVLLMGALAIGVLAQGTAPPEASQGPLTLEEAKAVVEAAYPGATVIEVEKDDDGLAAYEVELDTGLEVKVDINTGAILSTGTERPESGADADDGPGQ